MSTHGPEVAFLERWLRVPRRLAGLPPVLLVLATTTVAFQASVRVLDRFVPELLGGLGGGAITLGLFAAAILAGEAVAPYWRPAGERRTVVLAGLLAVAGTLAWTLASGFAAYFLLPAWAIVVLGGGATRFWASHGPASLFSVTRERDHDDPRIGRILRDVGILVLLAPFAAALAGATHVLAAVQLSAAFVAALGTIAVVIVAALPREIRVPDRSHEGIDPAEIRRTLDALPTRTWAALGSVAGMRFVEGSLLAFLIIIVTEYHGVGVTLGPFELSAAGLFAALMVVEVAVALLALAAGPRVISWLGPRPTIAIGAVALAAFPLSLVVVPSYPPALAVAFAGYGLRALGEPAREALFAETVTTAAAAHPRADPSVAPDVARSMAAAAAAPGAIVACLVFAVDPALSFVLTSAVGGAAAYTFVRVVVDDESMPDLDDLLEMEVFGG